MSRIPHRFYETSSRLFKERIAVKSLDWELARIGVDSYSSIGLLPVDATVQSVLVSFVIVADVNGVRAYE